MKVGGKVRDEIMAHLGDPDSRRIIACTLRESKTALAICKELDLPTSTFYRKLAELKECGLLMAEKITVRDDGKREPAYVCTFKEISLRPGEEGVELELVLSDHGMEKKWFELFFAKAESGSLERDGAADGSSSKA